MSTIYRIRFFSSFGPTDNIESILARICETNGFPYVWKNREIHITNGDDYTHVVLLNTPMPKLREGFPKENVVGLAFEPIVFLGLRQEFVEYAKKYVGRYLIGDKDPLESPFTEHYGFLWYCTPPKTIPVKNKLISIMISNKIQQPGHRYRHVLVQEIIKRGLPIDIWGRGCRFYTNLNDDRLKGDFDGTEPYEDYKFHISVENINSNHYFSEKIVNPLLYGTTPIYWGCKNINEYFPNNTISLSGKLKDDIYMFESIIQNPDAYVKEIDRENVRNRVYLLRNLDVLFE